LEGEDVAVAAHEGQDEASPEKQPETLDRMYNEALQAMGAGIWQRAVDLLSHILVMDPSYRDASFLLTEAGQQVRLSALYQAAREAVASQRWGEARDELEEIVNMDPGYLDAAQLLPRTQELADEEKADWEALPQELASAVASAGKDVTGAEESGDNERERQPLVDLGSLKAVWESVLAKAQEIVAGKPWTPWAAGVLGVALIVAIAALAFTASRRELRTSYDAAQAYMREHRWQDAVVVLDDLLEADSDYQDASMLRATAVAMARRDDLVGQAQEAMAAGQWREASTYWLGASEGSSDYRLEEVQAGICQANVKVGSLEAEAFLDTVDFDHLTMGIEAFAVAEKACPEGDSAPWRATFEALKLYLRGAEATQGDNLNQAIQAWRSLAEVSPEFSVLATQRLYESLLARGRMRREEGDLSGAEGDLRMALRLPLADTSEAQAALDDLREPTAAPEPSATATDTQAMEPTSPPPPVETPAPPTPTPVPDVVVMKYPAPELFMPEDGTLFTSGEFTEIVLQWFSVGELSEDEFYNVTVMRKVGGEPRYWGAGLTETQWQVPTRAGYGKADDDMFWWWVVVKKAVTTTEDGKPDGPEISPASEWRTFTWR
jgi:tetratricopeptide (TPR) repeat protein